MKASLNTTQSVVSRHGQNKSHFWLEGGPITRKQVNALNATLVLDLTSSFDCLQHASMEGEVLGDSGYMCLMSGG